MVKQWEAEIVIIGAGITGTTLARELSRYKVDAVVVEKGGGAGTQAQTKASGGMVYTGFAMLMSFILKSIMAPDAPLYDPDSQKTKWLEQGFDMALQRFEELDVRHRRLTTLTPAINKEEVKILESLVKSAEGIGVRYATPKWADRRMCSDMEPHLTKDVVAGLELTTNSDFNPFRTAIPRFRNLPESERSKLIAQDPRYGHVVCRCETITEGEIVEAIKRGARTVTAVKYMTRAGMGRCQGGFCGPRVVGIMARELNIPATQIMDSGLGSPVVPFESKELLREAAMIGE